MRMPFPPITFILEAAPDGWSFSRGLVVACAPAG